MQRWRRGRPFRSVVVFPIFGLALLLPKLQILWWSLGRGIASAHAANAHDDLFALDDDDPGAFGDDDYTRLA